MALAGMHRTMIEWLHRNGAKAQQVQDYEQAWQTAMANNGALIPCPRCFLQGSLSRLSPRSSQNPGKAASRCEVCSTKFEYPEI